MKNRYNIYRHLYVNKLTIGDSNECSTPNIQIGYIESDYIELFYYSQHVKLTINLVFMINKYFKEK